jgi:hypothetical protein
MDILLAGKVMSWAIGTEINVYYDVRMKLIDASITPQNRIILCRAMSRDSVSINANRNLAHHRLGKAYRAVHLNHSLSATTTTTKREGVLDVMPSTKFLITYPGIHLVIAFTMGFLVARAIW